MKISKSRVAAFDVLLRVFRDGGYSSVLLDQAENGLSTKDSRLCHNIVLGVIRQKLVLDNELRRYSKKSLQKLDHEVVIALEMGLFQLKFLDRIPANAAINESVELVKRAKKRSAAGFVNAILRKSMSHLDEMDTNLPTVPSWLFKSWETDFGRDKAARIADSLDKPSKIYGRNTFQSIENVEMLSSFENTLIINPDITEYKVFSIDSMSVESKRRFENGELYFQNLASQMVACLFDLVLGAKFLDVCAAPGGKGSLVALRNRNKNVCVISNDVHFTRAREMRSRFRLRGAPTDVVCCDAEQTLPFADGQFDALLIDAPCSGTGTIRSNPEIRFNVNPDEIADLSCKQLNILKSASKLLKIGGQLVYSTCSLQKEENESVVNSFLADSPEYELKPGNKFSKFRSSEGFIRTFPDDEEMDGFFVAELSRRA